MDDTVRRAHERLSSAFREIGYKLSHLPGHIDGVAVRDQLDRYLFAWHNKPNHLLFYLRAPALQAKSTLRQKAITHHPQGQVSRNPSGETTITLRSDSEAEALLGWLLPALTLP